jgi:HEAT repeat protein
MTDAAQLVGELLSDDEARAEAAVLTLTGLGLPALEVVLPLFDSAETETRWWAVRAAAGIRHPRSAAALANALEDVDLAVRQAAALGLRLQPVPDAAAALARHLADPDPLTSRLASDALAALGVAALPELRRAAQAGEPGTRINAVRALAMLKDQAAIPDLFAALEDPSTLVLHWAERGLEDLGVGMVFFRAE